MNRRAHAEAASASLRIHQPPEVEAHLVVLLGSSARARALLERTSLRHLAASPLEELERLMPRGAAKRVHAAFRLARAALMPEKPAALNTPDSAYAHLYPYFDGRETERFVAVACDARLRPLATQIVSEGSPTAVAVRAADVFALALRHAAPNILVAHCHPSGDPTPSHDDELITEHLADVGKAFGVELLDHLVIAGDTYFAIQRARRITTYIAW